MEYILKYIDDNLSMRLSLRDVAAYAGYSTWHFCEKFKVFTGQTFTDYLRTRRMQYAVTALLRGRNIQEISAEAGYETVSGFERAFFKQYRCSPAEYKQRSVYYQERYEHERSKQLHISDRCQILREQIASPSKHWDFAAGLYSYYFWEGFFSLPEEQRSNYTTQAAGLSSIIENFLPFIADGELLVGNTFPSEHIEQMERGMMDLIRSSPARAMAYLKRGPLSEQQIGQLFTWAARPDCRWPYYPGTARPFTQTELLRQEEGASMGDCSLDRHSIPDYAKVLRLGFEGICRELDGKTGEFYDGCRRVCRACCTVGDRYALLARQLALYEQSEARIQELNRIAQTCAQVPRFPARNFHEAVQSLYFAHVLNTMEDGVNANSLGRIDQLLYPYYRRDIDAGRLTRREAFELICCLWLKLYRNYDVQQCTIGGCDADGNDAVNELSYLILDVAEELDLVRCLSVRYGEATPDQFLHRAFEVLCHLNKGVNMFYNDEVMIPALIRRGIAPKDARDYAVIGCAELCIPGKSNPHPVTARCNLLKALEYALTGGESLLHPGKFPGVRGKQVSFRSFSELKNAVFVQMDALLDTAAALTERMTKLRAQEWPQFYKSLLTEGCLENGRSYCDRGAKYDFDELMLLGLPNLADAMAALQRLVFEEHRYTLRQVTDALRQNWPDDAMRKEFLFAAPKYGNAMQKVDALAAELMEHACMQLEQRGSACSDGFFAQMLSYRWSIDHGALTPATPDGRKKGEPLADGVSPMTARDFRGVAAALRSIATLPANLAPGGLSATVDVDAFLFSDCHLDLLLEMLRRVSKDGLGGIQFNIREAGTHDAVQVFGYRQNYEQLDGEVNHFIKERTGHQIL